MKLDVEGEEYAILPGLMLSGEACNMLHNAAAAPGTELCFPV
jgi:hypothetical protein